MCPIALILRQALAHAEEEAERLHNIKTDQLIARRQQKQLQSVFQTWTLSTGDWIQSQNEAFKILTKLKIALQVRNFAQECHIYDPADLHKLHSLKQSCLRQSFIIFKVDA